MLGKTSLRRLWFVPSCERYEGQLLPPGGSNADGLDELLAEVKAQGRNINQLTTLANMGLRQSAEILR